MVALALSGCREGSLTRVDAVFVVGARGLRGMLEGARLRVAGTLGRLVGRGRRGEVGECVFSRATGAGGA